MSEVKILPKDLNGFVDSEHLPYTECDDEIINWMITNCRIDIYPLDENQFIFCANGGEHFYTDKLVSRHDVYYTKEQFKEWIGMTKQEEKSMQLEDLVSGKHVVEYRDGTLRLVLDVGWVGSDGNRSNITKGYSSTMENYSSSASDIVKVYELAGNRTFSTLLDKLNLKLVWQRNEKTPEQIEAEKIRKEMEKLTERLKKLEGK